MRRRDFVTSAMVMAGAALSGEGAAMAQTTREYYLLRKYTLQTGAQLGLTQSYFAQALIPALNRMGIKPVGVCAGYRAGDADLLSAHSRNLG